MPSIYNHENTCWGIKRSSFSMLQYDINDEIQTRKLRGLGHNPNSSNAIPDSTYVQYSVSSNGYYGYQPHQIHIEANNDSEMDIEDITVDLTSNNVVDSSENISMFDCETFTPDLHRHNVRRKRQMPSDPVNGSKRIRQEEAETVMKSPIQESQQHGGGASLRCRRQGTSRVYSSEGDYESTTQLLRQTHGCELYLFERTCDY